MPAVASAAEPSAPAGSGAEKEEAVEAGRQAGREGAGGALLLSPQGGQNADTGSQPKSSLTKEQ